MNELVKPRRFLPPAKVAGRSPTPAPLEAGPTNVYGLLFGGPLPASNPWINQGPYIQYGGGEVVGTPTGLGMGPGTINCSGYFLNGQPLGNLYKNKQLYYAGVSGQTLYSLSTPDRFDNTATMQGAPVLDVTVGGVRLAMADGTGFGGYTVNPPANAIILSYPTGDGTPVIIDIYAAGPIVITPPVPGQFDVFTEILTVTAPNTFTALTNTPDGQMFVLYVNRLAFFAVGAPTPDFTFTANDITWLSTEYSVPMGSSVIATYTYSE
jgi:hypothetical protein